MRKIKKISSIVLFLMLLFMVLTYPINVFASANSFTNYAATYKTTGVLAERDLGYGVQFKKESATLAVSDSKYANGQGSSNEIKYDVEKNKEYTNEVSVLNIDLSKGARFVPYAALSGSSWNATSLRAAALDYEIKNPGSKVIAGVNGDFFQISQPVMASTGVTIGDGQYYKAISHHGSVNTLGFKNDGVGKQIIPTKVNSSTPILTIFDAEDNIVKKIEINVVNPEASYTLADNEIALYYTNKKESFSAKFDKGSMYQDAWLVDKASYAVTTVKDSFYGVGTITKFVDTLTEVTKGQFVIKSNNKDISALLAENVKIQVQYEFTDPSLEGIENFIGFPYTILENGNPINNDVFRHPRTMIGQKANGEVVLAVIDGRQEGSGLYGASCLEMAAIMQYYGCVDAWNLDGGGSSTMIIRKSVGWDFVGFNEKDTENYHVTNSPSDKGGERNDGNHLLVVVDVPEASIEYSEITTTSISLNVELLTDIEKYKELYIYMNNEFKKVENGKVEYTGLEVDTTYQFELYTKEDGKMKSLLSVGQYNTNKETPTYVNLDMYLTTRDNNNQILIRFKYDGKDAVKSIVLVLGENRIVSSGTSVLIEKEDFELFFENFDKCMIEVKYNINYIFEDEKLELAEYKTECSLTYLLEEIKYRSNSTLDEVFE